MSQLSGRSVKTTITKLDVASSDNSTVLMFQREGEGFVIKTRLSHQSGWDADGQRYPISAEDARLLGIMLKDDDAQYMRSKLDEIGYSEFRTPAPETHTEEEIRADCTQLDIERAKAENLKEERELLRLSLIRDHSVDRHATGDVDGCETCEKTTAYITGQPTPGGWDRSDEDTVNGTTDSETGEDLPF